MFLPISAARACTTPPPSPDALGSNVDSTLCSPRPRSPSHRAVQHVHGTRVVAQQAVRRGQARREQRGEGEGGICQGRQLWVQSGIQAERRRHVHLMVCVQLRSCCDGLRRRLCRRQRLLLLLLLLLLLRVDVGGGTSVCRGGRPCAARAVASPGIVPLCSHAGSLTVHRSTGSCLTTCPGCVCYSATSGFGVCAIAQRRRRRLLQPHRRWRQRHRRRQHPAACRALAHGHLHHSVQPADRPV